MLCAIDMYAEVAYREEVTSGDLHQTRVWISIENIGRRLSLRVARSISYNSDRCR
jgi:hypothetical protein